MWHDKSSWIIITIMIIIRVSLFILDDVVIDSVLDVPTSPSSTRSTTTATNSPTQQTG